MEQLPKGWPTMTESNPEWMLVPGGAAGPNSYCNSVQISTSPWDITLELSVLVPIPADQPNGVPTVSKTVLNRLLMSPGHAKAFKDALTTSLEQWEDQFGEIPPLPPMPPPQTPPR